MVLFGRDRVYLAVTMIFAFLAGMSFMIAVAACIAARQERERAQSCERALNEAMTEHVRLIATVAQNAVTLEEMIRAVAAASVPTYPPSDKVYIVVPGPRTRQ